MKDDYFGIVAIVGIIGSIFLLFLGEVPHATFAMVTAFMCLYMQDREG